MSLKAVVRVDHHRMIIDMNDARMTTLEQVREFLDGTHEIAFTGAERTEARYRFIESVLNRFAYGGRGRADRGLLLRYLERTTGYSRQQVTRLVRQYVDARKVVVRVRAPRTAYARKYQDSDIRLLAELDALHGTLAGPATRVLLERAYRVFGDARYALLSEISVAHLYNLRKSTGYEVRRRVWTRTHATQPLIGVRRAPPRPDGRPGYIRIDSVHQGDQDGIKGVYHVNAVDCVTQWELVATCAHISENYLLPVIQTLLEGFPFVVLGFHADNGSEYVNRRVAGMLEKLRIDFTRSRPRQSNDNALVETKNGAVVRKTFGYTHIPQHFALQVNTFCTDFLNPYVNFHRPSAFPVETVSAKGKIVKRYPQNLIMTPFDKLLSTPNAETFLCPGITLENLKATANTFTDNQAAERLNTARSKLFQTINRRPKAAA